MITVSLPRSKREHVLEKEKATTVLRRKRCVGEACAPRDGLLARYAPAFPGLARQWEISSGGRAVGAASKPGMVTGVHRYNAACCRAPAP